MRPRIHAFAGLVATAAAVAAATMLSLAPPSSASGPPPPGKFHLPPISVPVVCGGQFNLAPLLNPILNACAAQT